MTSKKQPLLLVPAFQDYIWGGTRLREEFGKDCSLERIAESWELSCHPDGPTRISGGPYDGQTLSDYIDWEGTGVLGTNAVRFDRFPVLVKLIDAKEQLSVQVHPDNDYALRVEGEYGKTELWYIVDCDPGAELIYGFSKALTREEFLQAIAEDTLLDAVRRVPVKKGDAFFIPAGTLHAIGKGILIAEIQQNSNTTYRVYDYGRLGADGKPRPLHVEKAADVTKLTPMQPPVSLPPAVCDGYTIRQLAGCREFNADLLCIDGTANRFADSTSFCHLLVTEGSCVLWAGGHSYPLARGTGVFLPAGLGAYTLEGQCELIETSI